MADTCEVRMEKTITALKDSFNAIRTGRASAAIFDKVRVDYYGSKTPLNQVATISIPEARSVIIQPFDKSLIGEIEKAIQVADVTGLYFIIVDAKEKSKSFYERYGFIKFNDEDLSYFILVDTVRKAIQN